MIRIVKLVFTDARTKTVDPVQPLENWVGDRTRWRLFRPEGAIQVYENLRAMPRAWLVPGPYSLPAAP